MHLPGSLLLVQASGLLPLTVTLAAPSTQPSPSVCGEVWRLTLSE